MKTSRKDQSQDDSRARAYADSRVSLWQKALQGDEKARVKLLEDMANLPRTNARIVGMEYVA